MGDIFVSSEGGDQSLDCCKLDFFLQATHSPFPDYYSSHVHLGGLMAAAITRLYCLSYPIWSDFILCIHPRFHEFVIYTTSLLDSFDSLHCGEACAAFTPNLGGWGYFGRVCSGVWWGFLVCVCAAGKEQILEEMDCRTS